MTERKTYPQLTNITKKTKMLPLISGLLLCCGTMAVTSATAQNNRPFFINAGTQYLSGICQNSAARSIDSALRIGDADAGDTEVWSIRRNPSNGLLAGFNDTALSTGGTILPSGLTYRPATGFSGTDTFVVQVNDGTDSVSDTVIVTVNPLPVLTSNTTPSAICDQSIFSYIPTSDIAGTTFGWTRNYLGAIANPPTVGVGDPYEALDNVTYYDVPVTYVYNLVAGGCANPQTVTVVVKPTPGFSSRISDTICNGAQLNYIPTSYTDSTSFEWVRNAVPGIAQGYHSDSGEVHEVLTNTTGGLVTTAYVFVLTAKGCTATRTVSITVTPEADITNITTRPSATVCAGTMYQNFGAGIPAPAGATYKWSVVNARLHAAGNGAQYSLVSFPAAGQAWVMLSTTVGALQCMSRDTAVITVSNTAATTSAVIFDNRQFAYLDNLCDSYQWGYDDAATLDSSIIAGATFQSYVAPAPDFAGKHYWVMVNKGGCTQKVYYNTPPAALSTTSARTGAVRVYPNPAQNTVSISADEATSGNNRVDILDMMGRVVVSATMATTAVSVDVSSWPQGCYLVQYYSNEQKAGSSRFLKN